MWFFPVKNDAFDLIIAEGAAVNYIMIRVALYYFSGTAHIVFRYGGPSTVVTEKGEVDRLGFANVLFFGHLFAAMAALIEASNRNGITQMAFVFRCFSARIALIGFHKGSSLSELFLSLSMNPSSIQIHGSISDTVTSKIHAILFFCNYSAAIHQDGEKPVLFVPYFFRELLGLLPLKQGHTE